MKTAVIALRASSISQKSVEATRQARARSPFSSSSLKTGTKAPVKAASATSARIRFGIWNATVNALIGPRGAEVVRDHDLANEPEHAREAGCEREDRRRPGEPAGAGLALPRGEYRNPVERARPDGTFRWGRPLTTHHCRS